MGGAASPRCGWSAACSGGSSWWRSSSRIGCSSSRDRTFRTSIRADTGRMSDEHDHPEHVRLARAACLRIQHAVKPNHRIDWLVRSYGSGGERTVGWDPLRDLWIRMTETHAGEGPKIARCAVVLSDQPEHWQETVDWADVGGSVAIFAPIEALCDPVAWSRMRSKPHTLIATACRTGVVLITRGRWPSDRQMRLVLV